MPPTPERESDSNYSPLVNISNAAKVSQDVVYSKSPGMRQCLRPLLWRSPYRYWLIGLIRQKKNILSRRFDILIDGYPRSANTFAVFAFKQAQQPSVRISSHHHNPAAVVAAIKMRKPVLVLLREPVDAVASWTVFSGYPIRYNLETYINYYSELIPYRERVCVGEFSKVTKSLPAVICAINAQFGTSFKTLLPSGGSQAVFSAIEREYAEKNGWVDENRVSRPSLDRQIRTAQIREQLRSAEMRHLTSHAESLYFEIARR